MPSKIFVRFIGALTMSGLLLTSPTSNAENDWDWRWAIGYGLSYVHPEGSVNGWSTDDDRDSGYKASIGARINTQWGVDVSFNDLGVAGLGNPDPDVDDNFNNPGIEYRVTSIMLDYSPWKQAGDTASVYGKFGLSNIKNSTNSGIVSSDGSMMIPYEKQSSVQFAVALGIKWELSDSVFMRTEFERFDRDAYFLSLQIGSYF